MSTLGIICVVILILVLVGGVGGPQFGAPWGYGYGAGHYGIGLFGVLLIVLLILVVTGRI